MNFFASFQVVECQVDIAILYIGKILSQNCPCMSSFDVTHQHWKFCFDWNDFMPRLNRMVNLMQKARLVKSGWRLRFLSVQKKEWRKTETNRWTWQIDFKIWMPFVRQMSFEWNYHFIYYPTNLRIFHIFIHFSALKHMKNLFIVHISMSNEAYTA